MSGPAAFEVFSFFIALVMSSVVKGEVFDSFLDLMLRIILRIILRVSLLEECLVVEVNILLNLLDIVLAELIGFPSKFIAQFGIGLE